MKYIKILCIICAIFILFPWATARAETHVTNEVNISDFTKAGSPYILESNVYGNPKITIHAGVTIMAASTTPVTYWPHFSAPYINSEAGIDMLGTAAEPIHLIGLPPTVIQGLVPNTIEHVLFENSSLYINTNEGYFVRNSRTGTTTITSIKVWGSDAPAIEINSGAVDIRDSEISNNRRGVLSYDTAFRNYITVHNTVFEHNTDFSLRDDILERENPQPVDARDNWWGSPDGPGEKVSGPVILDPWKTSDPRVQTKPLCCSNVLFLPGLEASRLYRKEFHPIIGTTTNQLWEPNRNDDVRKLAMDTNGVSIDPSIYTKDVVDRGLELPLEDIYEDFIAMMDSVVADKTINAWLPFAYDWRMSPVDIVPRLMGAVEQLASTSQTGKVTIIAHSNGGLVAKMLGVELEKKGEAQLLDKVVFVAVPQLGTAQAVAALLHGDDQSLGKGLILQAGVARTFGLTMPGAYGLLPSSEYFNRIVNPVVTFSGKAVGSFQEFTDFLSGKSDGRKQPVESDLKHPAVLLPNLLSKDQWMHSLLDTWHFPTSTDVVSLVGWGTPTTQILEYGSSSPRLKKNIDGDGTVVTESAAGYAGDGNSVYFNQGSFNDRWFRLLDPVAHADILEAKPVRQFLQGAISTSSLAAVVAHALPEYILREKPGAKDASHLEWLTASVHSPVDMDIYGSHGGHMGLIPVPGHPDSDLQYLENTIGGQYDTIGDEKYFTLPANDTYNIQLKGTGTGTFTFQVEKFVGESMTKVADTVYADLPVTPLLVASTSINSLATTTLNLDVDGNGTTDIKAVAGTTINPMIHLDAMKTIILSLHLKTNEEKTLLQKIEKVRILIQKDKTGKAIAKIKKVTEKVEQGHWDLKKLNESDKKLIVDMANALLADLATL